MTDQYCATADDDSWLHGSAAIARQFKLLGVSLRLETNSHELALLADEIFPRDDDGPGSAPSVRMRVILRERERRRESTPNNGVRDGKLYFSDTDSVGWADRAAGLAVLSITQDALADRRRVQTHFLEHPALFIVCRDRPVTLHAAAVVYNGRCVLLTGRQGAGKSTLAYACVRAGFGLLAEDIVFGAGSRGLPEDAGWFWGISSHLHLLPDAVIARKTCMIHRKRG
jgi:hypothetical protein